MQLQHIHFCTADVVAYDVQVLLEASEHICPAFENERFSLNTQSGLNQGT